MTPCRCAASCCDHRIDLLCIQAQASKPRSERTRQSALAEPPAGIERVRMITSELAIELFYQILIRLIGLVDKRCQRCRRWIAINDAVHRFSLAAARAACCRSSSSPDTAINALPRLKLSSSRTGDNQARIDRFDWLVASQAVRAPRLTRMPRCARRCRSSPTPIPRRRRTAPLVETTTVLTGIADNLLPSVTLSMWNLETPTMSRMSVPNALTTESAKGLIDGVTIRSVWRQKGETALL